MSAAWLVSERSAAERALGHHLRYKAHMINEGQPINK